MTATDQTLSLLEGLTQEDWRQYHSDSEVINIAKAAMSVIKAQQNNIESMNYIYGFVYGGQVKEIRKLVRCKDCKHRPKKKTCQSRHGLYTEIYFPEGSKCPCECEDFFYSWYPEDDWFCPNGEEKDESEEQDRQV